MRKIAIEREEDSSIEAGLEWQHYVRPNKQTNKQTDTVENITFKVEYSLQVCKIMISVHWLL